MPAFKKDELRNLGLASIGATLEYYDFVVYVFVASALGQEMFPKDMSPWVRQFQVFSIYAIGYLIRPVAGLVIAHFADKVGRKRLFVFTVLLMSVPTFLMGLLPGYAEVGLFAPVALLVLRILQGCAVGGELPAAAVFVTEHAPGRRLFFASGTLHGVIHCGLLLGAGSAALAALIARQFPDYGSIAWRLPFIIGGLSGLTAAYLRRKLEETPLFATLRAERKISRRLPLGLIVRHYRTACAFGLMIFFVQSVTSSVFLQYMSTYLITQYQLPATTVFAANLAGVAALALSMPLWGMFADRFGLGVTIATGASSAAIAGSWFFLRLTAGPLSISDLIWSYIPVGITASCVIALVPGVIASLFPTAVRQTGYALPYNFGSAIFSGPGPLVLAWSVQSLGVISPLYFFLAACGVALAVSLLIARMPRYLGENVVAFTAPAIPPAASNDAEMLTSGQSSAH
jgi:MFS family permease